MHRLRTASGNQRPPGARGRNRLRPVRADAPRYRRCRCGFVAQSASPVSTLVPRRAFPELHHLQVSLGAEMPFRQAATVLRTFLPDATSFNHATTRNRLSAVGRAIDDGLRAEIADAKPPATPAGKMVVGIDGCFVKGIKKSINPSMEVVLGRIESPGCAGEVFAVVRKLDDLAKERVRTVMRRCGRGPETQVVVLSDGEDGMRTMLGQVARSDRWSTVSTGGISTGGSRRCAKA
jgi:hypothetical protein